MTSNDSPAQEHEPGINSSVSLDDVLLYLLAKTGEATNEDVKVPIPRIHKAIREIASELEALGLNLTFEANAIETFSHDVDEALRLLIPYEVEIVNPSFSVLLRHRKLPPRIQRAESALSRHIRERLSSALETFKSVAAPAS